MAQPGDSVWGTRPQRGVFSCQCHPPGSAQPWQPGCRETFYSIPHRRWKSPRNGAEQILWLLSAWEQPWRLTVAPAFDGKAAWGSPNRPGPNTLPPFTFCPAQQLASPRFTEGDSEAQGEPVTSWRSHRAGAVRGRVWTQRFRRACARLPSGYLEVPPQKSEQGWLMLTLERESLAST